MKNILIALSLVTTLTAFGQGDCTFVLNGTGYKAPIYGVDAANPSLAKTGNTTAGLPAGTQTYGGALLQGAGFAIQLWGGASLDSLKVATLNGAAFTTAPRTGTAAGFVTGQKVIIDGVKAGEAAVLVVRAWDLSSGNTWESALIKGESLPATIAKLGGTPDIGAPIASPLTTAFVSFNLAVVPEPSVIALGVLGVGALVLFRRRK